MRSKQSSQNRKKKGWKEQTAPLKPAQLQLTLSLLFLFFFLALFSGGFALCRWLPRARSRGSSGGRGAWWSGGWSYRQHFAATQSTRKQLQENWRHSFVYQEADLEEEIQNRCREKEKSFKVCKTEKNPAQTKEPFEHDKDHPTTFLSLHYRSRTSERTKVKGFIPNYTLRQGRCKQNTDLIPVLVSHLLQHIVLLAWEQMQLERCDN